MFNLSVGEIVALGTLAAGQIASYAVLRQRVQTMEKKVEDECAPNSAIDACAQSIEQLTKTLETHYATQISVAAVQGKVDTVMSTQSAQTATLSRLESKLDAVLLSHYSGERRNV